MKIEKRFVDKKTGQIFFQFQLGPFKKTMATTVGVALRRVMMGNSKTVAITSAHGDLCQGNSIREDVFEFSLNLQQVVIKSTVFPFLGTGKLQKKGPAIVTAADIILPEGLTLINPYQYLCTINEGYTCNLALVLSSQPRTRFESGVALKSSLLTMSLSQTSHDQGSIQESKNTRSLSKKKESNDTEKTLKKSNNLLTKDSPQSLPIDSILVDPIYAPIQSCSFEVINVVGSYFPEYMELTKSGLNQTPEYLRMSVVSNGSIEPIMALQDAIQELYGSLSLFLPLNNIFASYYNKVTATEFRKTIKKVPQKIKSHYFDEIFKKVDVINLNLLLETELLLRRNGIFTIGHLTSTPLTILKHIGLTNKQFIEIKLSIEKFDFWKEITLKDWENLNN